MSRPRPSRPQSSKPQSNKPRSTKPRSSDSNTPGSPAADPASSVGAGSRKRLVILLVAGIGLLAVAYYLTVRDPEQLYLEARDVADANPGEAESLLYRAISAAGDDYPQAQLLLCQVLGAQGRWVESRGCFSLIKQPRLCDPQDLLRLSAAALAANERVLPEMALRAALESTSGRAPALRMLIQLGAGRYEDREIMAWCEELARLDANDGLPWLVMAGIHQRHRSVAKAIGAFQEALRRQVDPEQQQQARTQLVELLIQIEDLAAARRELDPLLSAAGARHSLRLKNARLLRLEGRPREALVEVNGVLAEEPDSIAALTLRGVVYLDLDQPQESAADLEKVIARQPPVKEAHYKLALAYRRLGRIEDSQQQLEISARLNRLSQEILALETRLERDPKNLELLGRLAELCQQAGMPERAARWRRQAESARRNKG